MSKHMDPDYMCLHCMRPLPGKAELCPACGFDNAGYKAPSHHLAPRTILCGRYLIGCSVGEGGFGIVYSAWDLPKGEHVAIKELFISRTMKRGRDGRVYPADNGNEIRSYIYECRSKFRREADALRQLRDKNGVVSIYSYEEDNNTAYIVMEYLEGVDLLTWLKARGDRISYKEAFTLLRPVMKSMLEIHKMGILHRDISPDNMCCMKDGRMKLMDFGSARFTGAAPKGVVQFVKNGYAPPEQYKSNYKVGPWIDVYAMSATFYRCVTGRVPPPSRDRHSDDDIVSPEPWCDDIPVEAERVLVQGMSLRPEDRWQDMHGLYKALKKASMSEMEIPPSDPPTDWIVDTPASRLGPGPEKKIIFYALLSIVTIAAAFFVCWMIFRTG